MSEINKTGLRGAQRGNAAIIALVLLVVAAVGAAVFFSGKIGAGKEDSAAQQTAAAGQETPAQTETAAGESDGETAEAPAEEKAENEAAAESAEGDDPGNPVVAKVNGKEITRLEVLSFIQTLPPQTRQIPVEQLFPLALDQVVNAELIGDKVKGVNLDKDPEVEKQMKLARQQIVRTVFMQKEAEKAVTEDMIKAAYEEYKKDFPKIEEVKARHILVKEEALAKDVIKQLEDGADFSALAKEHSFDATKDRGGELSFFSKQDVVPQFGEAAFSMDINEISKTPVKSDFGYHVIQVLEKRQRPPAEYEKAKPYLVAQLRGKVLGDIVEKWRDEAKIEIFDINGKPVEPAAGDEKPAAAEGKAQ